MTTLTQYPNDHPQFISNIEIFIQASLDKWKPTDLYLTRIDNWFDDKWIKFSGTYIHELSIWQHEEVTVPPFHPNRVIDCSYFRLEKGSYKAREIARPLHIYQASTDNLNRKIADFTENGLFIWYCGNSRINKRGVLMGYLLKDQECYTFYISLTADKNWNVHKSIGIPSREVQNILDAPKVINEA